MSVRHIPEGFHTVTPNLIVEDGAKAVAFLQQAFGAEELVRLTMPNGKIVHCELKIGDSRINLGESMEGWPVHGLVAQIYVTNSDEVFARAVAAGAKVAMPMTDMFFGSREGRVTDAFGNTWTIATRTEVVAYEEMQKRINTQIAG
jgi:PhnB protein